MSKHGTKHVLKRLAIAGLCAAALGDIASPAHADYPDRLVKMYIPYQGGAAENTARLMAAEPTPMTSAEFATSFRNQVQRWKDVTTKAKLEPTE